MYRVNKSILLTVCLLGATQVNAVGTFARACKNFIVESPIPVSVALSAYMYQLKNDITTEQGHKKIEEAEEKRDQLLKDESNLWRTPAKTVASKTIDTQTTFNKHSKKSTVNIDAILPSSTFGIEEVYGEDKKVVIADLDANPKIQEFFIKRMNAKREQSYSPSTLTLATPIVASFAWRTGCLINLNRYSTGLISALAAGTSFASYFLKKQQDQEFELDRKACTNDVTQMRTVADYLNKIPAEKLQIIADQQDSEFLTEYYNKEPFIINSLKPGVESLLSIMQDYTRTPDALNRAEKLKNTAEQIEKEQEQQKIVDEEKAEQQKIAQKQKFLAALNKSKEQEQESLTVYNKTKTEQQEIIKQLASLESPKKQSWIDRIRTPFQVK